MKCCDFNSGMLTELVTIERVARTPDGIGGFTEAWTADPVGGVWAHMRFLTGTERWEASAVHTGNLCRAVIRWRGDGNDAPYYTAADRLIWRNQEFAILAVHDIEFKREWLQLELMEGRAT